MPTGNDPHPRVPENRFPNAAAITNAAINAEAHLRGLLSLCVGEIPEWKRYMTMNTKIAAKRIMFARERPTRLSKDPVRQSPGISGIVLVS